MSAQLVKDLIDAGIHYGHRASRWNPKMAPYIFAKRDLIHIINVKETLRGLLQAKAFVRQVVSNGKDIVIVGTKRQARKAVEDLATEAGMHYVIDRWLGGTLTNFREIRKRIGRLDELEKLEAEEMLDAYSKKEGASLRREMRKIRRNLGGIRKMTQLPGAMVVIDQRREIIAVREAHKLNIPVIALLDSDSDPDVVDIPIPGNDDAMRAIQLVVREICLSAKEGMGIRSKAEEAGGDDGPRRRSSRATYRANDAGQDTIVEGENLAPDAAAAPAAAEPAATETPPAPAEDTQAPKA